jgi:hypothetical protein
MVEEKRMNELLFDYSIRSDLPIGPESPKSIGAKFVKTLDALGSIDPTVFVDWEVMNFHNGSSLALAEARPRIAEIIEGKVVRDDLRQPQPRRGYSASAFTDKKEKSHNVNLRVQTGGNAKGDTKLGTGDWKVAPDPAIVTYGIFKAALLALNAIWLPCWACAYAFKVDYDEVPLAPGAPLFPYSVFHVTWIGYLSAPLTTRMALPPPEIVTERTADGGLLMIATEDRLDPTNPEHLRRARIIAETMIARTGYSSSKPTP